MFCTSRLRRMTEDERRSMNDSITNVAAVLLMLYQAFAEQGYRRLIYTASDEQSVQYDNEGDLDLLLGRHRYTLAAHKAYVKAVKQHGHPRGSGSMDIARVLENDHVYRSVVSDSELFLDVSSKAVTRLRNELQTEATKANLEKSYNSMQSSKNVVSLKNLENALLQNITLYYLIITLFGFFFI